jgi:hypothetical protein
MVRPSSVAAFRPGGSRIRKNDRKEEIDKWQEPYGT